MVCDSMDTLVGDLAYTIYAKVFDKDLNVLYNVYPQPNPGHTRITKAELLVQLNRLTSSTADKVPVYLDRTEHPNANKASYVAIVDHATRTLDWLMVCNGRRGCPYLKDVFGGREYKQYAEVVEANELFVMDFSYRSLDNYARLVSVGRFTAPDGRSASALIARAMTTEVKCLPIDGGANLPRKLASIVMSVGGMRTTWLRHKTSGKWRGKGMFATI